MTIGNNQRSLDLLLDIIENIRARNKTLVLDKQVNNTLNLVATFSTLQSHGIERVVWLQSPNITTMLDWRQQSSIVYLTYGEPLETRSICSHIHSYVGGGGAGGRKSDAGTGQDRGKTIVSSSPEVHVILLGSEASQMAFSQVLEDESLLGDVAVHTWPIGLLQVEVNDLAHKSQDQGPTSTSTSSNAAGAGAGAGATILTLNLASDMYQSLASGLGPDQSIYLAALAIERLQQEIGPIPTLLGKGPNAQAMIETLVRLREDYKTRLVNATTNTGSSTEGGLPGTKTRNQIDVDAAFFAARNSSVFVSTEIDTLIVIDRVTDMLTPMLTQLTYEGLVDEFYEISATGQVDLPRSVVEASTKAASSAGGAGGSEPTPPSANNRISRATKKHQLNGQSDSLFGKIRDMNFAGVGKYLNQVARQLQTDYDQRHAANTVNEIKMFVSKLGSLQSLHQSLRLHTNLAEELLTKIEDSEFNDSLEIQQAILNDSYNTTTALTHIEALIDQNAPVVTILRLVIVLCLCKGGFHDKNLVRIKTHILQTYGHHHITTFYHLERAGLIASKSRFHEGISGLFGSSNSTSGASSNARSVAAGMGSISGSTTTSTATTTTTTTTSATTTTTTPLSSLRRYYIVDEQQDDFDPRDVSYAYSGYVPLSVRILQCVIDKPAITSNKRLTFPSTSQPIEGKWQGTDDFLSGIVGPTVEKTQKSTANVREAKLKRILVRNSATATTTAPTTMVFYLGGITRAEVSCIRHLAKQLDMNIVIATTSIISGTSILRDMMDN